MNKILACIICILAFSLQSSAQKNKQPVTIPDLPIDATTGLYTYTNVEEIPGKSKSELYNQALSWANTYYKNPTDVIREKNAEEGKILIKARYKIFNEADKKGVVTAAGDVMYTLTIGAKDGKYKYEISKINWQQTSVFPIERWKDIASPSFDPTYAYYLQQTDLKIKEVIAALEKHIKAGIKDKKDDW